ncbi:helix-turn-helix domain-containing protein [Clostridium sp. MCC344]|nr:helix-turn-helix domain-containing protein [Clostridium sp. MCC344]MBT9787887.1 helix-turn-helix domain-containing protein [Clostridium sp. MCC344]
MLDNTPDILTFNECREVLKIGKNSLLDLLHNKNIEGFRIGNRWKIPREALLEYIYHKY